MTRGFVLATLIVLNTLAALGQAPRPAPSPSAAALRAEKIRDTCGLPKRTFSSTEHLRSTHPDVEAVWNETK